MGFERFDIRFAGLMLGGCVFFMCWAWGRIRPALEGGPDPSGLYKVDTKIDDQVEQWGF